MDAFGLPDKKIWLGVIEAKSEIGTSWLPATRVLASGTIRREVPDGSWETLAGKTAVHVLEPRLWAVTRSTFIFFV
jgi:hypothetical protein